MRKKPNLDKRLARCAHICPAEPESLRGKWKESFGYTRICIEIGCGKGRFITETSKNDTNTFFIGIEREQGALVMAMEKAIEQEIKNVRFLDVDAEKLCEIFEKGEIDGIYLNFSDPWPKKKQVKRRLTHSDFLSKYDEVLSDDGFIYFKTDNSKLFEFSLNSMSEYGLRLRNITFDLAESGIPNVVTEYEARFMEQGMNIYRVEAYKWGDRVERPFSSLNPSGINKKYTGRRTMRKKVIVIGAGAAGLLAAGFAGRAGADVLVLEKNSQPGKKLNITGKGRCNITNNCDFCELLENIPQNPRFMYSAFSAFSPQDTMQLLEGLGIRLKTERGFRVFPESDSAREVTNTLVSFAKQNGATIKTETVCGVLSEDGRITGVRTSENIYLCDAVIVATGGVSYPLTGSTGDGYIFAESCGHTVKKPQGSLVPLVAESDLCRSLQGLTLKNVTLTAKNEKGDVLFSELGEMLFTHFGLSGPLVLSASAHMRDFGNEKYYVLIDLKPGLTHEKLEDRILRDIEEKKNKDMRNLLRGLLPSGIIPIILAKSGISADVKANALTREMRRALRDTLKALRIDIDSKRPIAEAIITSGGVNVREINPKTMESKITSGLFFAGEVIDVDAYTGGFNLQIAWSTAYCAGTYSAKKLEE